MQKSMIAVCVDSLTGVGIVGTAQAQDAATELPPYAIGLSVGYESGELNDTDYDGFMAQARFIKPVWTTYPLFFYGVDVTYRDVDFDEDGFSGEGWGVGPVVGAMIPLDRFMDMPEGAPRGLGAPVYVRYNFIDDLELSGPAEFDIDGESLTVGGQIPLPINLGYGLLYNIQAEYTEYFHDDQEVLGVEVTDIDRSSWAVMFQVGIPIGGEIPGRR